METSPDTAHSAAITSPHTKSGLGGPLSLPTTINARNAWCFQVCATKGVHLSARLLAYCIATHVFNDDGFAMVGVDALSTETGLTPVQVRAARNQLVEFGLLKLVQDGEGKGGAGYCARYFPLFDPEKGSTIDPFERRRNGKKGSTIDPFQEQKGSMDPQKGVNGCIKRGQPLTPPGITREDSNQKDPSLRSGGADAPTRQRLTEPVLVTGELNGRELELDLGHTAKPTRTPKPARPTRSRTEWPKDFVFDHTMVEMAREHADWDRARCEFEFRRFRAHHEARGNQFKNWRQAWGTWCLNGKKFDAERPQNGFNGNRSYQPKPTVLDDVREAHRRMFPEKYS
jgi:hypothetical protein